MIPHFWRNVLGEGAGIFISSFYQLMENERRKDTSVVVEEGRKCRHKKKLLVRGERRFALAMSTPAPANCSFIEDCRPLSCVDEWWKDISAEWLVLSAVMVFLATFLPRIIVRLIFFSLAKLKYIRLYVNDCLLGINLIFMDVIL